mmetsp:Transcript_70176/g.221631  ORF Transcript_70176/g.221631 Transcript_70176/m.221631 type:complete len:232 (+) Transcript_70176:867-1562(+)
MAAAAGAAESPLRTASQARTHSAVTKSRSPRTTRSGAPPVDLPYLAASSAPSNAQPRRTRLPCSAQRPGAPALPNFQAQPCSAPKPHHPVARSAACRYASWRHEGWGLRPQLCQYQKTLGASSRPMASSTFRIRRQASASAMAVELGVLTRQTERSLGRRVVGSSQADARSSASMIRAPPKPWPMRWTSETPSSSERNLATSRRSSTLCRSPSPPRGSPGPVAERPQPSWS